MSRFKNDVRPFLSILYCALFLSFPVFPARAGEARSLLLLPSSGSSLEAPGGYRLTAALGALSARAARRGALVLSAGGFLPPQRAIEKEAEKKLFSSFALTALNVTLPEVEAALSMKDFLPYISANLRPKTGSSPFSAFRIVEREGRTVAVLGAVSPVFESLSVPPGASSSWSVSPPEPALREAARKLDPAVPRILLFRGSDDEALSAARAAGASLIVLSGHPLGLRREETAGSTILSVPLSPGEAVLCPLNLAEGKAGAGPLSVKTVNPEAAPFG